MSLFKTLFKTRTKITNAFSKVFKKNSLSEEDYYLIEESLISADISWELTDRIIEEIKLNYETKSKFNDILLSSFKNIIGIPKATHLNRNILMVGVNGVGKTTSCAKLAYHFKHNNKSCSLVAADTYRAAAVEQLRLWSEKINVNFISNLNTSDPASIAFDGVKSGESKGIDYTIIDTAGRLHTSANLMNELQKIYKVISKVSDKITVIISIDANIGQNGLKQIEEFNKFLPLDGIFINKMDGTAKGGVGMTIIAKYKLPIFFLGVGEKINDFIEFDLDSYISSLISFEKKDSK